ncbi:uncharacterized protein LOC124160992 isoform X2 [Ischnura elegans]|nr:uncharacterized protein LOC124160992 isoform X2 [Ischnura elegans]
MCNDPDEELDESSYLNIPNMTEDNQLHSYHQLYTNFKEIKFDASEDNNCNNGDYNEIAMEVNTDEEKLNKAIDSTSLDDEINASQFPQFCDEQNGQDWYTKNENFEYEDLEEEFITIQQEINKRQDEERYGSRTDKVSINLIKSTREKKKICYEKGRIEQANWICNKKSNWSHDSHNKLICKIDHRSKESNLNEHIKNFKRPVLRTSSIISVTTVPSTNFKKENKRHFSSSKDNKFKTLSIITDRSDKSKPEFKKKVSPTKSMRNRNYHQATFQETIPGINTQATKNGPWAKKHVDNNECGDQVVKRPKMPRQSASNVISNSRQNLSFTWKDMPTERTIYSERQEGQNKKANPAHTKQPISISLVKKGSNSSKRKSKNEEKETLDCIANQEKNNNKTRALRNGFGLHTIASKLKMSQKMHGQRQSSKYPFIVGKATTPSHNLVLNIQQTLSIIKMKPSVTKSQTTAMGAIEYKDFPSITTNEGQIGSKLTIAPVNFAPSGSSVVRIQNCPLINQAKITTCIVQNDMLETQDWYLFQEKYGDASSNKCLCYPRNCTNYHKVINYYLHTADDIQFSYENERSRHNGQIKKYHQMDTKQGETMRERLAQILRQFQNFQWMHVHKQGV